LVLEQRVGVGFGTESWSWFWNSELDLVLKQCVGPIFKYQVPDTRYT
jgi:hypothetical protein